MEDQRKEARTHLIYYLRVYEPDSQDLFGHVVDISKSGMLITSDKPMRKDNQYRLEIEDVSTSDDLHTVGVHVECRWCQGDEDSELYDAGFQLVNPTSRVHEIMESFQ